MKHVETYLAAEGQTGYLQRDGIQIGIDAGSENAGYRRISCSRAMVA